MGASTFSWTPDLLRAERTPREIVADIARTVPVLEIETGQCFRSFPRMAEAEVRQMRSALEAAGARAAVLGLNLDDHLTPRTRRSEAERMAFLEPQLRAAGELGAAAVRLPLGQAGPALLDRLLPLLAEHDLVLLEEIQGSQDPADPPYEAAVAEIASRDDPRLRLLLDTSMLMSAVPPSFLAALEATGTERDVVHALAGSWHDPATTDYVRRRLADGAVPPAATSLCMTVLIRFGRLTVGDLEPLLPLVGGIHLKFWDLEDTDQVASPLRPLGDALRRHGFAGTLCSEWGGHDWLTEDASALTRSHLELVREALAPPVAAKRALS